MNSKSTYINDEDRLFDHTVVSLTERARHTLKQPLKGFPHYADTRTGEWTTTEDGFWTGGFWLGVLWLGGFVSGDLTLWQAAEEWVERLEPRVNSDSVFRGFLFYFGCSVGADLAGSKKAETLALDAARSLCATFRSNIGLMPLGTTAEEAHTVGENETNIDSLSASLVLAWAAEKTGDDKFKDVAIRHALTNAHFCVREDGSVCQSASFDSQTGKVIKTYTHKGFSANSTWARAQAWAMMSYAYLSVLYPENREIRDYAEKVCRWWTQNVPDDGVAYWDFDAPQEADTPKDTSATSIACYALLTLATVLDDRQAARVSQRKARNTVKTLCRDYVAVVPRGQAEETTGAISPAVLTRGCFDPMRGVATEHELIWGDYFLLHCLGILTGLLPTNKPG